MRSACDSLLAIHHSLIPMNYRFVISQLGLLLGVLSFCMLLIVGWEATGWLIDPSKRSEQLAIQAMLISMAIGGSVALALWLIGRRGEGLDFLGRREALLLVALSWLLGAVLAALPYYLWTLLNPGPVDEPHIFDSFIACYFEATSGLTTTGATVLSDIDALPQSLLLWRATTHWLGGLGIVVLFVAVLPTLGVGGKRLFQAEPGPQKTGVRPRIVDTARMLLIIYLGMTLAGVLALRLAGMKWFDSICHSLSMVATGGLSTRDPSIGHYDKISIELVCLLFMLLAGVNFALFFQMTRGRLKSVGKDVELRVYLALKVIVIVLVTLNIWGAQIATTAGEAVDATIGQALRYASFQTIALHTGTGFVTADYDPWPFFSRALLVGLMFIGGCAGSTAGGIKVIRFWIALKVIAASLEKAFRPQVVRPLRVGAGMVDDEMKLGAVTYFLLVIVLFAIGAVLVALFESNNGGTDFMTAMSASISTLCNVGPGLHEVGATKNYGWFTDPSLAVLSLLMVLGRLEVFAIFVLFVPSFWRQD